MPRLSPGRGTVPEHVARKRRRPAPKPKKPTPAPQTRRPEISGRRPSAPGPRRGETTKTMVRQAKAQERTYGSPAVSDRMARYNRRTINKNRKRRERLLMQARRRKYFDKNALRGVTRSRDSAIQALADLKAQDPEKYERRQRSWLSNAARDVADYVKEDAQSIARSGGDTSGSSRRLVSTSGAAAGRGIESARKWAQKYYAEGQRASKRAGLDVPVVDKLAQEAIDITANAPTGAYMTGDALVSAAKGDRRKLKKLGKEFEKSSALVPLVKGDLKEAGKRAKDRPLTTFLELSGGKALVGRGVGAGMRRAPSKRLRGIASPERAPQRLYTDAETKQRSVKGNVPVGGKRGPAVERRYSRDVINKGIQVAGERIQRRRGHDPNVDRGNRVIPGRAPWRRQLDREVDRQVFASARALEQRRVQAAKRANKATGRERERLLLAARADKIRAELKEAARLTPNKPKKRALLALAKLPDRDLIKRVDRGTVPRVKTGRKQRSSPYTKEEQAAAVKAIDRRARRGKLPEDKFPELTAALKDAGQRHIARDVAARNAAAELPGAAVARAVVQTNGAKVPPMAGGARPRAGQPSPLAPEDFAPYFESARHTRSVPPRQALSPEEWDYLSKLHAADSDIMPTAVSRAVNEAGQENAKLIAAEFGIPVGKRGYVSSYGAAERQAYKVMREDPDADLVPLRVEDGKYMLAPRRVVERYDKHAAVDRHSPTGTAFDHGTRLFKDVVLTTSSPSRWLGGNVADIGLRSMNEGLTPFDVARGFKIGGRMKRQGLQGEQAWSNLTGGGLMGIADDLAQLSPAARWNLIGRGWRGWKRTIYTLEHSIEKTAQAGMVGKQFRRENQRQANSVKGLLKMQDEALDRYAQGLSTNRAFEARVAREVENLIGRWGKVSPGMRRSLALAPFAQWLGASVRYVYVTLPVHHPIKTGILAGIMQMTESERKALGLSYFAPVAERAPDYQMGLLPTDVLRSRAQVKEYARKEGLSPDETERLLAGVKHGPVLKGTRTSRMTSFGTAANPGDWPGFALPQFAGAFDALTGTSFTGEPLEYPADYPEDKRDIGLDLMDRLPVAAGAQLETAIPFASMFRRSFLEGGQPAEPFSTILTPSVRKRYDYNEGKYVEPEGSWKQGLKKWLSPVSPEGRVYTLGAQRDIDATQKAMKKIEQWNEERIKTPGLVDPYDSEAAPAVKKDGQFVDPYGAKPRKKKRRPQETFIDPYATP
jgi:hypothetical protein